MCPLSVLPFANAALRLSELCNPDPRPVSVLTPATAQGSALASPDSDSDLGKIHASTKCAEGLLALSYNTIGTRYFFMADAP